MIRIMESFVDLTYRGLPLGRRIKLTQVRPTTGYLELAMPMPVGTQLAIATDEGIVVEATVVGIHEQVGGSDRAPGMTVAPELGDPASATASWWQARVALPAKPEPDTVRMEPVIVDDGKATTIMSAVDQELDPDVIEQLSRTGASGEMPVVDDGKKTIIMESVDVSALGLEPADDDETNGSADGKRRKKRKTKQ